MGFPVFARGLNIRGTTKRDRGDVGDPITLGGVVALVVAVAALAALLPAWRAARVEPMRVLREE